MSNPYEPGRQLNGNQQAPLASVRTMQIVAAGLIMGLLIFFGIVLVVTKAEFVGKLGVVGMVAAGFAGIMIANHFFIPGLIAQTQLKSSAADGLMKQSDDVKNQRLLGIYQAHMIVALALLEGAGFFNLIALMVEKSFVNLGIAIALLALMAIRFPTASKVESWIQDKLRDMQFQ